MFKTMVNGFVALLLAAMLTACDQNQGGGQEGNVAPLDQTAPAGDPGQPPAGQ